MAGSEALGPPFDDLTRYQRPRAWGSIAGHRSVWSRRRRYLERHVRLAVETCEEEAARVRPAWLLAVLWDELARRDLAEGLTDWVSHLVGRDASMGPFQITGGTAREVVRWARWGEPFRDASLRELRARLLDEAFAARVALARLEQIVAHWSDAGFDPEGGLGPHGVTPLALCGTLYSQGLGRPKATPQANGRGLQIVDFADQVARTFDVPQ